MQKKITEKQAVLTLCEEPEPLSYAEVPEITGEDYKERLYKLWKMPQAQQYTAIIIYGDREHFSNIYYFTGYDPRFEEALLILKRDEIPVLIVGTEGFGYAEKIPYEIKKILYPPFGLMGQPGGNRDSLKKILWDHAGSLGVKIGLIGWKYYNEELFEIERCVTDVPSYIVDTLSSAVGSDSISNAVDLLMDSSYGLRHHASAKEIIQFEVMGTKISRNIYKTIKNLKKGMTEIEASELLGIDGEPLCTHPNVNFGDAHVSLGLSSPVYGRRLEYGMPLGVGYGLRGSNVHKMGMYIRGPKDLPKDRRNYVDEVAKPYFSSIAAWYEMVRIGAAFGDIYDMVEKQLGIQKYNIILNPGHLIHTDEWTNSPFEKGNSVKIHSGHVIQCDYSVCFKEPYLPCHIEDGLAVGNEALQKEIEKLAPGCGRRIQKRKKFMREILNINLPDEVLPLSDLPAVCFPYMADVSVVLAVDKE